MSIILAGNPAFPVPAKPPTDQLASDLITTNSIMFLTACRYPFTFKVLSSGEASKLMHFEEYVGRQGNSRRK